MHDSFYLLTATFLIYSITQIAPNVAKAFGQLFLLLQGPYVILDCKKEHMAYWT